MNRAETNLVSSHLLAEQERLLSEIDSIRCSGQVAPAYCWLVESTETKAARTYRYIKLITQVPGKKLTSKSLGKPSSKKHRDMLDALGRREQIAELEQQLKMLQALIERQMKSKPQ